MALHQTDSSLGSEQHSADSAHSYTPSTLQPTPTETDTAAVPLAPELSSLPPTDTSESVVQSVGISYPIATPTQQAESAVDSVGSDVNHPSSSELTQQQACSEGMQGPEQYATEAFSSQDGNNQAYAYQAHDASQVYTQDSKQTNTPQQDKTEVRTSQSQDSQMSTSQSQPFTSESGSQYTDSHGNPTYSSEHLYPPSSSNDPRSNTTYPPRSSYGGGQDWGSYTQPESQHKQNNYDNYSNEYSYSSEASYDYNRGSEYYEGYKRDYSGSYDQSRGWNKGDYQYGYSGSTYRHQQATEYSQQQSDPNYGQQQSDPNYGHQQSDPNYGQQQSDHNYNQQQSDPNYGQQQSDSNYGQHQADPNYGRQQSDPNYGQRQLDPNYSQQQSNPNYGQQQSDPNYNQQQSDPNNYTQQQSGPNYNQQQSDPQKRLSGDYNQQPPPGSGYDQQQPQRDYSQGNYSSQSSYDSRGYDNYSQSYRYDNSYYQDKPYYGDSGHQHSYPDDRNYSRYSSQYDSYYDQSRPYQQHRRDEHSYRRDPRRPRDGDTQVKPESKGSDTFVQRRSAMFRRAEIQQVSKTNSRSSRGPQIVQPHRLAETSDSKKSDKSKQSESLFPKRNLDSFKIPKKKSANSAPSPVKKTIPIPALDTKVETQTEQVKSSPVKVPDKKPDTPTTGVSSCLTPTSVLSTVKPTDVVATASSSTSVSSAPPPVTTVKKKHSSSSASKPRTTTASQKTASAKRTAPPTVLSTLDPKTLLSLAVTLQKTLEQASAQKNAAKLSTSVESVPTNSPSLASSSVVSTSTLVTMAPISSAAPSVTSAPPAVTSSSPSTTSQVLLVPKVPSLSVALNPPPPSSSPHSPMPLPSELPTTSSAIAPTFPASIAISMVTATPSLMATSSVTTVSVTPTPLAVTSIASNVQATSVISSPLPIEPPVPPTSTTSSVVDRGSSAGVVLATVISSNSTAQLNPESSNTSVAFSQTCKAPVSTKNISQIAISSLSSLVNAICSATAQNKGPSTTVSSVETTASQQHKDLNQQASSIKQESRKESVRKRSRSPDVNEVNNAPLNKKLKSEDECQSNTTASSSISVSSLYGNLKTDKLQSVDDSSTFIENQEKPSMNGQLLENKPDSSVKDKSTSRRRSISKSKKKVHASKHIPRSSSKIVCCLCHKLDSELSLGFLFGPYKSKPIVMPSDNGNVTEKSEEASDLWIHEDCAVWTPGICLVGGQLLGLQEAVNEANKMVCTKCKESGATLCCGTHNCKKYYHYHCARESSCFFDDDKYLIGCPKHSSKSTV